MHKNKNIFSFENHLYLASSIMHYEKLKFANEVYDTNWMSTIGKNIDEDEKISTGILVTIASIKIGGRLV